MFTVYVCESGIRVGNQSHRDSKNAFAFYVPNPGSIPGSLSTSISATEYRAWTKSWAHLDVASKQRSIISIRCVYKASKPFQNMTVPLIPRYSWNLSDNDPSLPVCSRAHSSVEWLIVLWHFSEELPVTTLNIAICLFSWWHHIYSFSIAFYLSPSICSFFVLSHKPRTM